jgi:hypothetical protein
MVMSPREAGSFALWDDLGCGITRAKAVVLIALTVQAAETPPRKDLLDITRTPSIEI